MKLFLFGLMCCSLVDAEERALQLGDLHHRGASEALPRTEQTLKHEFSFENKRVLTQGTRTKAFISKVVGAHSEALKTIFQKYQKEGFEKGEIHLRFTITPMGSVIDISKIFSNTNNISFDIEIVNDVKKWNFGPSEENTQVTIPLTFTSSLD